MPEPPVYFAFTGGRQIGPLHFAELADLAARGVLQPEDLAWKSGTPQWVAASQLLAFPKRRTPSGFREAGLLAPLPAEPSEELVSVADTSGVSPVPGLRPAASAPVPGKWPRVSLVRGTDDPGVALQETREAGDTGADEAGPGGAAARRFSLASVLPVRRLNDAAVLGSPVTWALVFFGLGPLFISAIAEDPLLRIRLFDFGCGALWVAFFYAAFRPEGVTSRTVLSVFFASVLFAFLYFGVLDERPPVSTLALWAAPGRGVGARLLAALGGVALVQEAGKLLVLLLVGRAMKELNSRAEGLFLGLITGASFGLCTSLFHGWPMSATDDTALRGAGEASVPAALYATFLGTAVRAVSQPFLQAVWTGIAGAFLAPEPTGEGRKPAPGRIALGLGLALVLHGVYEAFSPPATAFFAVLVAAASLALLLALRREAEEQPIFTALR